MASDSIEMNGAGIDRSLADPLTLGRVPSAILTLPAGAPAGTVLATLRSTRWALYGGMVLTTVGSVPAQLALVGNQIVKTATAAVVGATYSLTLQAAGASGGGPVEQMTISVKATAATSTGQIVAPTPTPTPTPTPSPKAYLMIARGQSNNPGRGAIDGTQDTDQANIKQFCDIPSRTSTYRTIRNSALPLYHPEDRISENFLSPVNYAAKVLASTLPSGDIVLIVPTGWGGTSLLNAAANGAPNAPHWSVGRSLHENLIAQANAAVAAATAAGYTPIVHSIIDVQGEADNTAVSGNDYGNALTAAIADMRSRITGGSSARIVLGGFLPEKLATLPALQEIEDARKAVAASVGNAVFVRGASGYVLNDGLVVHYNAAGTRVNGRNIGAAAAQVTLAPTVTFLNDVTQAEGNSGTTAFVFNGRRSTYSGAVTVPVTFAPGSAAADDFAGGVFPSGLVLNFADNSDAATVTINVNGDTASEAAETFTLTVAPTAPYIAGAKPTATGMITDDETGTAPTHYNATYTSDQVIALADYTSESGHKAGAGPFSVGGGRLYSTSSGTGRQRIAWTAPAKGYGNVAVIDALSLTGGAAITWRDADTNNYYWAGIVSGSNTWGVYKTVNGTTSAIGTVTQPGTAVTAGQSYELDVYHGDDDMLSVKVNGVTILPPTLETTFTTGSIGHRQSGSMSATTGYQVTSRRTYSL